MPVRGPCVCTCAPAPVPPQVTGIAINAVAAHCPSLTALYLERAGRIYDDCVVALSKGCPRLRILDLGWCEVGDPALYALAAG